MSKPQRKTEPSPENSADMQGDPSSESSPAVLTSVPDVRAEAQQRSAGSTQQTSSSKLLRLEAIRGLAALYVVLHHTIHVEFLLFGLDLGRLLRFGQEAVILFFLVSGFVIHFSCQVSNTQTFRTYFIKRSVRIYVPLVIVFFVGWLAESYNSGALLDVSPTQLLGNLFMLHDWPPDMPGVLVEPLFGNNPLWSLAYEWWFYMLYFPLIQLGLPMKRLSTLVFGVAVVSCLVYTVWPTFVPRIFMYFAMWWSGAFLADLYINRQAITVRSCLAPILTLGAICTILLISALLLSQSGQKIYFGKHPFMEFRHAFFALFALLCALAWHRLKWRGFDTLVGPFMVFAPISYVVYISHHHLMVTATWFDFVNNALMAWIFYFLVLILFSWFVELKLYPMVRRRLYAWLL